MMATKLNGWMVAGLLTLGAGAAIAAGDHAQHTGATAVTPTAAIAMTAGEVRKVDPAQGKLTIKHEPITNLGMPAMTMVFRAAKPDLLKNIQVGDKIQFRAETVAGGVVVTDIQPGK
ncbi:MAG: copper-binding protein [Ramlibacter sp.]|nr:copper-binding protein [Ramlibacter sp.]